MTIQLFRIMFQEPFLSLSKITLHEGQLKIFEEPSFVFIEPQHEHVFEVYSSGKFVIMDRDPYSRIKFMF